MIDWAEYGKAIWTETEKAFVSTDYSRQLMKDRDEAREQLKHERAKVRKLESRIELLESLLTRAFDLLPYAAGVREFEGELEEYWSDKRREILS